MRATLLVVEVVDACCSILSRVRPSLLWMQHELIRASRLPFFAASPSLPLLPLDTSLVFVFVLCIAHCLCLFMTLKTSA